MGPNEWTLTAILCALSGVAGWLFRDRGKPRKAEISLMVKEAFQAGVRVGFQAAKKKQEEEEPEEETE